MDWMQFVSSLTASLAWPVAAIVVFLCFKEPLVALLPLMSKISFPGGSAEFGRGLDEVEETAKLPPAGMNEPAQAPEQTDPGHASAEALSHPPAAEAGSIDAKALKVNPAGVVMEAWKAVELTMRDVISKKWPNAESTGPSGTLGLIKTLYMWQFIDTREEQMLKKLLALRNMAAHEETPITEENAERFQEITGEFVSKFKKDLFLYDHPNS